VPQHQWERQFEGFGIRTKSVDWFSGTWYLDARFDVFGNKQAATVRSAKLRTATGEYSGFIDERVRHLPAGGGGFSVRWEFDQQHITRDVLGKSATIVLDLLVGTQPQIVYLDYVQDS